MPKKTVTTVSVSEPTTEKNLSVSTKSTKAAAKKTLEKDAVKKTEQVAVKEEPVKLEESKTDGEAVLPEDSGGEVIIKGLLDKVSTLGSQIKLIQSSLKQLMKEFDKQKKIIDKVQKKRDKAKKSPSGFAKPCKISDELCDFMGIKKGSEQSRTDITRFINAYVKEHNLNNPENRREFFPDKKLKSILNIKEGEKVTYFVLQRLIAHHFPPSQNKLAAQAKA